MRYWEQLTVYQDRGFEIVVDKSWEDIHPSDLFDSSDWDVEDICSKIDSGHYDWFVLRVRAFFDGHDLGNACLGGCLYERAEDVLEDGTVKDLAEEAIKYALEAVADLRQRLNECEFG